MYPETHGNWDAVRPKPVAAPAAGAAGAVAAVGGGGRGNDQGERKTDAAAADGQQRRLGEGSSSTGDRADGAAGDAGAPPQHAAAAPPPPTTPAATAKRRVLAAVAKHPQYFGRYTTDADGGIVPAQSVFPGGPLADEDFEVRPDHFDFKDLDGTRGRDEQEEMREKGDGPPLGPGASARSLAEAAAAPPAPAPPTGSGPAPVPKRLEGACLNQKFDWAREQYVWTFGGDNPDADCVKKEAVVRELAVGYTQIGNFFQKQRASIVSLGRNVWIDFGVHYARKWPQPLGRFLVVKMAFSFSRGICSGRHIQQFCPLV
jgi:hypothetical protein